MPHWKALQDKDYLGSWDFEPGEEKVVTITGYDSKVLVNPMNQNGSDGKPKVILTFKECKKAVMNTTNLTQITELLGSPDIDSWIGKQIVMHVEKVRGFGKMMDGIRVMNKKPQVYRCEVCGKEITAAGSWSAKQIADRAKKDFGACLCVNCAKERSEKDEVNE